MTAAGSLPWSQEDTTRPIFDVNGLVVSFTAHAPRIVAAMNLVNEIAQSDDDIVPDDLWDRARRIAEGKL